MIKPDRKKDILSLPDAPIETKPARRIMACDQYQLLAVDKIKYPLVNRIYKTHYKKGIANKQEQVFTLNSSDIICLAKLKSLPIDLLLCGVMCIKGEQGKGYASSLIRQLLLQQEQPVYCFPYQHLKHFYQRLGFTIKALEEVPPAIQSAFLPVQQKQKVLLMCYSNKDNNDA